MTAEELSDLIRIAFKGVALGNGVSILQSIIIDHYGEGYTEKEFQAVPKTENTTDWEKLTETDLEKCEVAHLDAEGILYYIPALMCSILTNYDSSSLRVIGTLRALYPKQEAWDYCMERYSALNQSQRQTIAQFLKWLPEFVELDTEDRKVVERALKNYWKDSLTPPAPHSAA